MEYEVVEGKLKGKRFKNAKDIAKKLKVNEEVEVVIYENDWAVGWGYVKRTKQGFTYPKGYGRPLHTR